MTMTPKPTGEQQWRRLEELLKDHRSYPLRLAILNAALTWEIIGVHEFEYLVEQVMRKVQEPKL